jgi:5-methylcytosine-specific restriction protein B
MSLDRLVQIIHSSQQGEWSERDEEAFKALFGSPDGRYPKAAEKSVRLRAPEMSQDSSVPFAEHIQTADPTKGAYGGFSFVVFPAKRSTVSIALVVRTQELAPDQAILGRPGHARKAQAICAWLNKTFGVAEQIAWAKPDPTRIDDRMSYWALF